MSECLTSFSTRQSQPIEQPLKCSMFTQTEQTNSFTQTEQSNSSYGDQRQVCVCYYFVITENERRFKVLFNHV